MKKDYTTHIVILVLLALFAFGFIATNEKACAAFTDPFTSYQLATSTANGYVLQTDGTENFWVATSTLGIGGGLSTTSPFTVGDLVQVTDGGTVNSIATTSLGLLTTNVAEGTNLYYTEARVIAELLDGNNAVFGNATTTDLVVTSTSTIPFIQNINNLLFDTNPTEPTYAEGNVYWDNTDKTLTVEPGLDAVKLQVGQELHIRVRNNTGSTITDGSVTYISGATGNRPTIALADANDAATSEFVGLATHDIENNTDGIITIAGLVRGVDTSAFSIGDKLYISTTAGELTNVIPTGTDLAVTIGTVLRVSPSIGTVLVRPSIFRAGVESMDSLRVHSGLEVLGTSTLATTTTTSEHNFLSWLDLSEISSPSAAGTNALRVFANDDNGFSVLKIIDSNGDEREVLRDNYHVVRNNSGIAISKGDAVYISGSTGVVPEVTKAQANALATSDVFGLALEDISDASFGRVLTNGDLGGLDTSAFSDGDALYLSTTTAGELTNSEPSHPHVHMQIGTVIKAGAGSSGMITVDVHDRQHIEDGTLENTFAIGDETAGTKTLTFSSSADGSINWDGSNYWFNDGNVGIGTTTPSAKLQVDGSSSGTILSLFSDTGTKFLEMLNTGVTTLLGTWDFGDADALEIPNGTNPTANDPGEIAHDTTDDQLILDDKVIPTEVPLYGFGIASTSSKFASGTVISLPQQRLGYTVTTISCYVTSGTSKVISLYGESITCDTNGQEDDGTIASPTVTALSTTTTVTMGAETGSVDDVNISIFGNWTRQ